MAEKMMLNSTYSGVSLRGCGVVNAMSGVLAQLPPTNPCSKTLKLVSPTTEGPPTRVFFHSYSGLKCCCVSMEIA